MLGGDRESSTRRVLRPRKLEKGCGRTIKEAIQASQGELINRERETTKKICEEEPVAVSPVRRLKVFLG